MDLFSGIDVLIRAAHKARGDDYLHGHTWRITGWWEAEGQDAEQMRLFLAEICADFDHHILPERLSRGEQLAEEILGRLPPNWRAVEVHRDLEGIRARAAR